MSDSLRDQLLGLGFKPAPKPVSKPESKHGSKHPRDEDRRRRGNPDKPKPAGTPAGRPRAAAKTSEMDLAKAYAIRAQQEKQERIEAERQKQEAARLRREAKARLAELLKDKALNAAEAEIARHFPYGGKIKRVYVTPEQLVRLNAGELGVLQLDGRYLLVTADVLAQAEAIFPAAVALRVDPDAPASDDPYADPKYQVPDDLVW
jgi:uncharacterized protein YaiL (DUF2058 family)